MTAEDLEITLSLIFAVSLPLIITFAAIALAHATICLAVDGLVLVIRLLRKLRNRMRNRDRFG